MKCAAAPARNARACRAVNVIMLRLASIRAFVRERCSSALPTRCPRPCAGPAEAGPTYRRADTTLLRHRHRSRRLLSEPAMLASRTHPDVLEVASLTDVPRSTRIPVGEDRLGRSRSVFGVMPFAIKVSSRDSGGASRDRAGERLPRRAASTPSPRPGRVVLRGRGRVRHQHRRGDAPPHARRLRAGSAARPHAWALVGHAPGRMVIAFWPAGRMEEFFDAAVELDGTPAPDVARPLFAAYGMEVVGPPLAVE